MPRSLGVVAAIFVGQAIKIVLLLFVSVHLFLDEILLFGHQVLPVPGQHMLVLHLDVVTGNTGLGSRWELAQLMLEALQANVMGASLLMVFSSDGLRGRVSFFGKCSMLPGTLLPILVCAESLHFRFIVGLLWLLHVLIP
jgi:hypothetical protein